MENVVHTLQGKIVIIANYITKIHQSKTDEISEKVCVPNATIGSFTLNHDTYIDNIIATISNSNIFSKINKIDGITDSDTFYFRKKVSHNWERHVHLNVSIDCEINIDTDFVDDTKIKSILQDIKKCIDECIKNYIELSDEELERYHSTIPAYSIVFGLNSPSCVE